MSENAMQDPDDSGRGKARRILEEARGQDPLGRLPSSRACAAKWGMSEATFRRARRELEEEGGPAATRPNGKWVRLLERIRGDIAKGHLRPGDKLDSGTASAARYSASHPTLRKVLRQLVNDGILVATPRGAEVPRPRTSPGTRILMVQSCGPEGLVLGEAERMARFRREIELHAHKAGTSLEVWGYAGGGRFFQDGRPVAHPRSRLQDFHGSILSLWDLDDCDGLLEVFRKAQSPVAVWDERPKGGGHARSPLLRYFTTSYSVEAGAAMARHLAAKGHVHVAYVSPLHGSLWSRMRLQGIREAAAANGMTVTECVSEEAAHHRAFEPVAKVPERFLRSRALRAHLGAEISRFVDDLDERVAILLRLRRMRDRLSPLFAQARESRASVWVCANDDVALLAWAWLAQQGCGIPASVGLAGFDDTLAAQAAGLASYHFNEGDLAAACVGHVLAPRRLRNNENTGRVTGIEGFVVARPSVGTLRPRR